MRLMDDVEAYSRAAQELEPRRGQMTEEEFTDAIVDRARQLLGQKPLARLQGGRRPTAAQRGALAQSVHALLNDFTHVAVLGEVRIYSSRAVATHVNVLFRLTQSLDIGFTIAVYPPAGAALEFTEIGREAAVRAYDSLDAKTLAWLLRGVPR